MKILLVVPPYRTTDTLVARLYPLPYGLAILASVLRNAGHDVVLKDFLLPQQRHSVQRPKSFSGRNAPPYYHYGQSMIDCLAWLEDNSGEYDAVGINLGQCNIAQTSMKLVWALRTRKVPVVVGGPYATTAPEEVKDKCSPSVVVIGEGEAVVEKAFHKAVGGAECEIVHGTPMDIDAVPSPAWDLVDLDAYPKAEGRKRGVLAISRGCPWGCRFCSVHTVMGRKYRRGTKEKLRTELLALFDRGVRYFCFLDDNLFFDEHAVADVCGVIEELQTTKSGFEKTRFYVEEGLEVRVAAQRGVVQRISRVGFDNIAIGLESMNAKRRAEMKKPFVTEDLVSAIRNCEQAGITAKAFYIVGLPGDSLSGVCQDIVNFGKLGLAVRPNNLKLYPSTGVTQDFQKAGLIGKKFDWRLSSFYTPDMPTLSYVQIRKLKTILGAVGWAAEELGVAVFRDGLDKILKAATRGKKRLWIDRGVLRYTGRFWRKTSPRHFLEMLILRFGGQGAKTEVCEDEIRAWRTEEPRNEVQAALGAILGSHSHDARLDERAGVLPDFAVEPRVRVRRPRPRHHDFFLAKHGELGGNPQGGDFVAGG